MGSNELCAVTMRRFPVALKKRASKLAKQQTERLTRHVTQQEILVEAVGLGLDRLERRYNG